MSESQQVPCPICNSRLKFTFDAPRIISGKTVTLIVIEHTKAHCNNCGRDYAAVMQPNGINFTAVQEIPPESAIIAPAGIQVPS